MAKRILLVLSLIALVFAGVSGASWFSYDSRKVPKDTITCQPQKPQKDSSELLWTCRDYQNNEHTNLKIFKTSQ